jgi:hypothetical protein
MEVVVFFHKTGLFITYDGLPLVVFGIGSDGSCNSFGKSGVD